MVLPLNDHGVSSGGEIVKAKLALRISRSLEDELRLVAEGYGAEGDRLADTVAQYTVPGGGIRRTAP
jgi:hypothetical protein